MTQKHRFDLQSADKSPAQLALSRRAALNVAKAFGRLRLDAEACTVVGYGVVVSVHRVNGKYLIVELDSVEEAMAFVAEANGETGAASGRRRLQPFVCHQMAHIQHLLALPAIGHELTIRHGNAVVQAGNIGREQLGRALQPVMTDKHRWCVVSVGDEVFDANRIIRNAGLWPHGQGLERA